MTDFRFQSPQYATALWVVLVAFALLVWLEFRRGNALQRLVTATMQPRMVLRGSRLRRLSSLILLALAGCCFVVGLMRPQYGLMYVNTSRVGAQIMFCLDVSKSMLAEDTAPNRLERAKADINDLLTYLDGDQVGLIGFAGRASVLCPLTPDYGFFKMVLADANSGSVGMGGTRLEEPLRKALDGFRNESDVSRVIFLITDGEDHDSHPLDVAADAIERGIKVVAVGIGDEAGSEIRITDPRTGVQTQITDADGRPVVSRLDGDTLRELALSTEGVYIPAGTGSLDLRSIYETHLRPLVRNEMQREGRAVRREAFQWALLVGLFLLMASLGLAGLARNDALPSNDSSEAQSTSKRMTATLFLAFLPLPTTGFAAESTSPDSIQSPQSDSEQQRETVNPMASATPAETDLLKPRESFNRGLAALGSDNALAEKLLTAARLDAGTDGEVRYRATYNLGWVAVRRADAVIDSEPETALKQLETASGWFRDAVRLRPDSEDARHNLEAVLRRVLQLRDQLAKKDDQDLEASLDAFIERLRAQSARSRQLVQAVSQRKDANAADEFRGDFSKLAVDQRVALSDLQGILAKCAAEMDSIEDKSAQERSPEENVRLAQLGAVQSYLNQGAQRLGQSRSQLRRRQGLRSFRRTSTSLNQLKRARDQLRDPIQRLDSLLKDSIALSRETRWKSLNSTIIADPSVPRPPIWLDQEYLTETQTDLVQRTNELTGQLQAGLDQAASAVSKPPTAVAPGDDTGTNQSSPSVEQQQFISKLRLAMPYLNRAASAMSAAERELQSSAFAGASTNQEAAVEALQQARERFADLKTLIELAHAAETQIAGRLTAARPLSGQPKESAEPISENPETDAPGTANLSDEQWIELQSALVDQQLSNLERMDRLSNEIESALTDKLSAAENETNNGPTETTGPTDPIDDSPPQEQPEIQQLKLAVQLAARATDQMKDSLQRLKRDPLPTVGSPSAQDEPAAEQALSEPDSVSEKPNPEERAESSLESEQLQGDARSIDLRIDTIAEPVDGAVSTLQDLRRLFFSIIQHLQETTQRQAELNDATEQAAGISNSDSPDDEPESGLPAKLADRQDQLQMVTQQIGESLSQQAEQSAQTPQTADGPQAGNPQAADNQQQQMMQENADRSAEAADLLDEASDQMVSAQKQLAESPAQLNDAREFQDVALAKLIEALQTLQPPQENEDQQGDDGQQNQQQNQNPDQQNDSTQPSQQSAGQQQKSGSEREQSRDLSPARMLQAVRDREAQRRKDRDRRQAAGQAPVDKDW